MTSDLFEEKGMEVRLKEPEMDEIHSPAVNKHTSEQGTIRQAEKSDSVLEGASGNPKERKANAIGECEECSACAVKMIPRCRNLNTMTNVVTGVSRCITDKCLALTFIVSAKLKMDQETQVDMDLGDMLKTFSRLHVGYLTNTCIAIPDNGKTMYENDFKHTADILLQKSFLYWLLLNFKMMERMDMRTKFLSRILRMTKKIFIYQC